MVWKTAEIEVAAGREAAFEAAVAEAAPSFQAAQGCRSLRLERGVERPSHNRLPVGWDRVEDHIETFRDSPAFQRWRELAGPHFASAPRVEHVAVVLDAF